MIHHYVMIKLKQFSGQEEKLQKVAEIKNKLEALQPLIEEIKYFEVGQNINESERAADLILISSFNSLGDLEAYRIHPEHKKVLTLISENAEKVTAVDFEK